MGKRIYFAILVTVALLLGASMQATAQDNSQKNGSQQQKSEQQNAQQQSNSDKHANSQADNDDRTSATKKEDLVGEAGQKYLLAAQKPSQVLSSSLIGMTVRNKAEKIGTVKNLILDKNYQLVGIVVDMSGLMDLIQKSLGVSMAGVENIDLKKGVVMIKVNKQQLQDIRTYTTQQALKQKRKQHD